MAIKGMLRQRCAVLRIQEVDQDGAPIYTWVPVVAGIPCLADTYYARAFARLGQRGGYRSNNEVTESQRAAGRSGQLTLPLGADAKPGDRLVITTAGGGSYGVFELNADLQVVADRQGKPHHLEGGIVEVARPLGRM